MTVDLENSRVIVPTDRPVVSSSAGTAKAQASYALTRCKTESAPPSAHKQINTVLKRHETIFAKTSTSVGRIKDVVHTIHTNPHPPIQRRPYRRPQHEYDEISRQVSDLLEKKLIRPSTSPWAFPVTLAPKKDGSQRLCIDFRPLNAITIDDKMPLPRIDEVIDRLSNARYFTTLDVAWGYWHVAMDPASVAKTAFITHEGHYEWLFMPFGLKNAPATFQKAIQAILGSILYKGAINYLDDIIIYTETLEQHADLLNDVLNRLKEHGVRLKESKCSFAQSEVAYLGHTISYNAVKPSPEKLKAILDFPEPNSIRSLRQFLGICQWFRRFVPNFTRIAKPLTKLMRKNAPFLIAEEQKTAIKQLKQILTSRPTIGIFNKDKPCTLYTDGSAEGIGAILTQTSDEGKEHVIEFFSRRITLPSLSASELECLAVIEAIEHFEPYLSLPFVVYTDHSALQWLLNMKNPKGRLYRWSVRLSTYTFKIIHRSGRSQAHVDALSRAAINSKTPPIQYSEAPIISRHVPDTRAPRTKPSTTDDNCNEPKIPLTAHLTVPTLYHSSPFCSHLSRDELVKAQAHSDLSFVRRPIHRQSLTYVKHGDRLKVVVPEQLRDILLVKFHDLYGHTGKSKLLQLLSDHYWWPTMVTDAQKHIQSCIPCQRSKPSHQPTFGRFTKPEPALRPKSLISADTIVISRTSEPLPELKAKFKYIHVFIDNHSRYVWAAPAKSNSAQAVETQLLKLFRAGIIPEKFCSDNGTEFKNNRLARLFDKHKIKQYFITPYHPSSNGITERVNGTIVTKLRLALLDQPQQPWYKLLPDVIQQYNRTPHSVTGFTPTFLFFGDRDVPDFIHSRLSQHKCQKLANERTARAVQLRQEKHDIRHKDYTFDVGDRVFYRHSPPSNLKFTPIFDGPFVVVKKTTDTNYLLATSFDDKPFRVHISQLKPFFARQPRSEASQPGEDMTN